MKSVGVALEWSENHIRRKWALNKTKITNSRLYCVVRQTLYTFVVGHIAGKSRVRQVSSDFEQNRTNVPQQNQVLWYILHCDIKTNITTKHFKNINIHHCMKKSMSSPDLSHLKSVL